MSNGFYPNEFCFLVILIKLETVLGINKYSFCRLAHGIRLAPGVLVRYSCFCVRTRTTFVRSLSCSLLPSRSSVVYSYSNRRFCNYPSRPGLMFGIFLFRMTVKILGFCSCVYRNWTMTGEVLFSNRLIEMSFFDKKIIKVEHYSCKSNVVVSFYSKISYLQTIECGYNGKLSIVWPPLRTLATCLLSLS